MKFNDYLQSDILKRKSLENQFIYPSSKGSKLILAAPSSPANFDPVLRSPWGRGNRRTGENQSLARFTAPFGDGVNEENQWGF
jgi:hypothetical protein